MRYRFLRFPNGKSKAVTFSYDDGCRADKKLSTLLTDYSLKGTFNLNSKWIGKSEDDWHLSKEEIQKYIVDNGHEIAVHGAEHKANGNIRPIEGIKDVLDCRLELEKYFGFIVRGMAYPDTGISQFHNGTKMSDVEQYLKSLDIVYARALGEKNDTFNLPENWFRWMPTAHHNSPNVFELIDKFLNHNTSDPWIALRTPILFYIWGHAYELDNNNNWDRMDNICKKLSGKEDIWYATNIEIYDYVNAYNSLIFSADSSIIYNPSIIKLWFEIDTVIYTINPGETIHL